MNEHISPEITVSPTRALTCSLSERTLAIITHEGIRIWCRSCTRNHILSFAQLDQIRRELSIPAK